MSKNLEDYLHITLKATRRDGARVMSTTEGVRPRPGESVAELVARTVGPAGTGDLVEIRVMREFWMHEGPLSTNDK